MEMRPLPIQTRLGLQIPVDSISIPETRIRWTVSGLQTLADLNSTPVVMTEPKGLAFPTPVPLLWILLTTLEMEPIKTTQGFADSNTFALDTTDGNSSGSNTGNEQNASVSGTVSYQGVVPGPAIIWALDANDTVIDHAELPDGNGSYSLSVPIGQGYDFKVFIDGNENGYPSTGEAWKHFADWNSTTNSTT